MSTSRLALAAAFAALAACTPRPSVAPAGTLITNAQILDGAGAAARRGAVRIVGGKVAEVGSLSARAGETVIDGGGLTLAPGFIDTHSHGDRGIFEHPGALAAVSQGITTIVVGQDGGSVMPLAGFFSRLDLTPAAVNVASYAGHGSIRDEVMGQDFRRAATSQELERMKALLRREMDAGALGLSAGLEYDPGIYSAPEEMVELARTSAEMGGRYISHIRSEDRAEWAAIDEIIRIGSAAHVPVQISHAKLAMRSLWGQTDRLFRTLDSARAAGIRVTADVYPYTYWQSTLTVLFPERNFEDRRAAEWALAEVAAPEGMLLGRYEPNPSYSGRTLADVATERKTDAATALMDLIRDALAAERAGKPSGESVIATSMDERDVERLLAWPYANICTDGELAGRHPRGYGSFPRVLGRYVRERKVMSLPEAVRKMTSLAADNVGIRGRGKIAPGMAADLVLFDPATVIDRATPQEPHALSEGIARVWVNGVVVYQNKAATGARPGKVLRRGAM